MNRNEAINALFAAIEERKRVQSDNADDAVVDALNAVLASKPAKRAKS